MQQKMDISTPTDAPTRLFARYQQALNQRRQWDSLWQECYAYSLPRNPRPRTGTSSTGADGPQRASLFDGTAADAVETLAASLLSELTPSWNPWFDLASNKDPANPYPAHTTETGEQIRQFLDLSNFSLEIHQAFLDLVIAGTAAIGVHAAGLDDGSGLRFCCLDLSQIAIAEDDFGQINAIFREHTLDLAFLLERYPDLSSHPAIVEKLQKNSTASKATNEPPEITLLEAVIINHDRKAGQAGYCDYYLLDPEPETPVILVQQQYRTSPIIVCRWMKSPGAVYGRSPLMKALPDIKTANKVVELILKNASIAVTGIWQADDDGVLNPATIRLVPGTIIPKAVGSSGLTPLQAPGRFDISDLVLDRLQANIRRALLADQISQPFGPNMTATEILERSNSLVRLLGATYGRLQAELLMPLAQRITDLLVQQGRLLGPAIQQETRNIRILSPIANQRRRLEAQNLLQWVQSLALLGPAAQNLLDPEPIIRRLAESHGLDPATLITPPTTMEQRDVPG